MFHASFRILRIPTKSIRQYRLFSTEDSFDTSVTSRYNIKYYDEGNKDINFMKLALRHAQFAFREEEVPIGAVVVDEDGLVIASSRNRVESLQDASSHAEIDVLKKAAEVKKNWRLLNCTLYTTLEPCPMCLGAIYAFRIKRLVYGANDKRVGSCGSWINIPAMNHPYHSLNISSGVLADESEVLLKRFFQSRRRDERFKYRQFSDFDRGVEFSNSL